MIEYVDDANYDAAKRIWMTCFGDNEEYTNFLFDGALRPERVLTCRGDGKDPVAILCLQPFTLKGAGKEAEAVYVFGVATLPAWRNRGIGTALLREMERRCSENGIVAATLVPAGESLFGFYGKQGYETAFSVKRVVLPDKEIPKSDRSVRLEQSRLNRLAGFRDRFYSDRSAFVQWPDDFLAYVDREARALGGGTFSVFFDRDETENGYVVCYPYKGALVVKEIAVADSSIDDVVAALHARFGAAEYRMHLPADAAVSWNAAATPFAMTKWFDPDWKKDWKSVKGRAPYIAHVLDGPTLGVPLNKVTD